MTRNSILCRYIHDNPDTWQADLEKKKLKFKIGSDNLAIFNYDIECDFSDPIVQESRGIIIDLDTLDVACWPFRKFGNSFENYADPIDWNRAVVQQKVDGSICKLFWNPKKDHWQWATNSMTDADEARINENTMSFYELIQKAVNYPDINAYITNGWLDKDCTYIFELVSPENQIVIHYMTTRLYAIGKRDNRTGRETVPDIEIENPKDYPLNTYEDCLKAAEELNAGCDEVRNEGFVVVDRSVKNPDGSFNRIKIKSPEYVALHHAINNGVITKKRAIELIRNGQADNIPHSYRTDALIKWYEAQYAEFKYMVAQYIDYARGLYEEMGHDRKTVAEAIKGDVLRQFGFAALDNDRTADEIIKKTWVSVIEQFIDDYKTKDIKAKR